MKWATSPSHLADERDRHAALFGQRNRPPRRCGKKALLPHSPSTPKTASLKPLNTVKSGGAGPTYVSLHPSGKFLLVANYFGGSGCGAADSGRREVGRCFRCETRCRQTWSDEGEERTERKFRVQRPRPHPRPPDSGRPVREVQRCMSIWGWIPSSCGKFDAKKGTLTANDPASGFTAAGRRAATRPLPPQRPKWLYSVQEEGSTVVRFDYDADAGKLTAKQTISTLPRGYAGSNFCSEILVPSDGKFVYVGNRLHDSIGIFAIGENGDLTPGRR